jgi:hypothetical protein
MGEEIEKGVVMICKNFRNSQDLVSVSKIAICKIIIT